MAFTPQPIGGLVRLSRPSLHLYEKWGLTRDAVGRVTGHTDDGHVEVDYGDGVNVVLEPIDLQTTR